MPLCLLIVIKAHRLYNSELLCEYFVHVELAFPAQNRRCQAEQHIKLDKVRYFSGCKWVRKIEQNIAFYYIFGLIIVVCRLGYIWSQEQR